MKLKVVGSLKAPDEACVLLRLVTVTWGGEVALQVALQAARDDGSDLWSYVASVMPSGRLVLHSGIDPSLGLCLDDDQKIEIEDDDE